MTLLQERGSERDAERHKDSETERKEERSMREKEREIKNIYIICLARFLRQCFCVFYCILTFMCIAVAP